jgi:hypothetical protein
MPSPIPDYTISNFLARHTVPLPVYSLPNDSPNDQLCPICNEFYSDPPINYMHPDFPSHADEYACQVRNIGGCKHVFGRRCLEKHIRSNAPWSHTCPLCRKEWFPAPNRGRVDVLSNLESALNVLADLEVRDAQVRREVDHVERALGRIRDVMYENRWI